MLYKAKRNGLPVVVQIIPSELDPNMDMVDMRLCPGLADTLDTELVVDYLGQMTILRTAQDTVVYRSKDCSYLYQVIEMIDHPYTLGQCTSIRKSPKLRAIHLCAKNL